MKYIVEFQGTSGKWFRSGNRTANGVSLDIVEFDNKWEAQTEADRQQDIMGVRKYRVTVIDKGEQMKIGEHEVTNITRDKVKVGCQEVTRSDIEGVLAAMNVAPSFSLRVGTDGRYGKAGDVWIQQSGKAVTVMVAGAGGTNYAILDLTPDGIRRHGYIGDDSGFKLESSAHNSRVVRLTE